MHAHVEPPVPERERRPASPCQSALGLSACYLSRVLPPWPFAVDGGAADEVLLAVHPAHGALRHIGPNPRVGAQRAHDERDARLGVLASDVAEQLAQLGVEVATTALVRAGQGQEGVETTALEGVEPALEGRDRVAAGRVAPGRANALLADAPPPARLSRR